MGQKPKDITGYRYGKLVTLNRTDRKKGNCYLWLCKCDCGEQCEVSVSQLNHGEVTSCGCIRNSKRDITNKRFGKLVALYPTDERNITSVIWRCKCDCGNECNASINALNTGKKISCGCAHKNSLKKLYVERVNVAKIKCKKLRSTNTSGVTGVSWSKTRGQWEAEIRFKGIRYKLGRYADKAQAVAARKAAENRLHGDFLDWYENEHKKDPEE